MKISVIVPCHGRSLWLGAQLEALAAQDWSGEWEVLVADNRMSPDARAVVDSYVGRLPSLKVIDASLKKGAPYAKNRAAAAAEGEALLFVDSDDVVEKGWLTAMAIALERHELCAPSFEYEMLGPADVNPSEHHAQERSLQRLWYPPWIEHAGGCGIGIWRTTYERVGGFDEELVWLEDTDFCVRLALAAVTVTFVRDAVIHIRVRDSARGRLAQAYRWARANCLLYSRYGRRQLNALHAWREYGADSVRLFRRMLRVRNRSSFLRSCSYLGRHLGLLHGTLRYAVPPPVMPRERSSGPSYPAQDGTDGQLLARGPLHRIRRSRLGTLVSVRTNERLVALTFDDGPDPRFTPRLLDILKAHGARATFFLIGDRAERYPEIVRQIAEAGHAIGNHTYSHRPMPELDPGEQAEELERCREAIGEFAAPLFRPPYGQQSESTYRAARRAGNEVVGWSVMSGDWRFQEAGEIATRILEELGPGSIVLLHDSLHDPLDPSAADRGYALDAVEQVLTRVGSYTQFVTVPELMSSGKVVRTPWFTRGRPRGPRSEQILPPRDVEPVVLEGRAKLGVFGAGGVVEPTTFTTEWVPGVDYGGMQDSDIRGFLDGGFKWAWNQPGQVHVRVGRLGWTRRPDKPPELGERELFRTLHRWEGLDLPASTEVLDACLTLQVEVGQSRPVDVCMYEVFQDWIPGAGGIERNNVSVPAAGEVWWNEVAAESKAWSKPGAGQTGSRGAGADTPETALASARYEPGDSCLKFCSPAFASYVQRRTSARLPLLLLFKLSDVDEDREGSVLTFWSAEHSDDGSTATRPRLTLEWLSRAQLAGTEIDVKLEQGRALSLPALPGGAGRTLAAEWVSARPGWQPTFQLCSGADDDRWGSDVTGLTAFPEGTQVRLLAAASPLRLGDDFRTGISDTWVTSGPPEEQIVEWAFVSPSGVLHQLESSYRGGYRWEVSFRPEEIGIWRYYWTHSLTGVVVRGAPGRFDVVGSDLETVLGYVESLAGEVSAQRGEAVPTTLRSWEQRLMTLERAAVSLSPTTEWVRDGGKRVRECIARARASLDGNAVPLPLPMVSHKLVTKLDGRPLYDTYPDWTRRRAPRPFWRKFLRRARNRMKRLLSRNAASSR